MDWALVTFDKAKTQEQRQALADIRGQVFPVKWKSFKTAEGSIDTWTFDKNQAHATLNSGKTAEVKLQRFQGMTNEPAVLPNELERYQESPNAFEFKGTNGFMLTFDMTSKDVSTNKTSTSY